MSDEERWARRIRKLEQRNQAAAEVLTGVSWLSVVLERLERADEKHGEAYSSWHEAYGVLAEEVAELFDEIREQDANPHHIRSEAIDIAVVALRIARQVDRDFIPF